MGKHQHALNEVRFNREQVGPRNESKPGPIARHFRLTIASKFRGQSVRERNRHMPFGSSEARCYPLTDPIEENKVIGVTIRADSFDDPSGDSEIGTRVL